MRDAVVSLPEFFPEVFAGDAVTACDRVDASPLPRELFRFMRWGADYPGVAELWPRWCAVVDDLSEPDVELTAEAFAPMLAMFNRLERMGVVFDEGFSRLMRGLEWRAIGGEDDGDADDADALLDQEDGDEDRGADDDEPDFPPAGRHAPPPPSAVRPPLRKPLAPQNRS